MTRFHFRLTLRRRLLLLTAVPVLGLIAVGGAFLQRVYSEYTRAAADRRVFAEYRGVLDEFTSLQSAVKAEREAAFLVLAEGADAERLRVFDERAAATDRAVGVINATISRLLESPHGAAFVENAKTARNVFDVVLPTLRAEVRARRATTSKAMSDYAAMTFRSLRIAESLRTLIQEPNTLNYFDGLFTLTKMREQEAMIASLFHLAEAGHGLKNDDIAVIRKQYSALTESETYVRRYFPALFQRWEAGLRADPTSTTYYKLVADLASRMRDGETLAPYNKDVKDLRGLMLARYAAYTECVAGGFAAAGAAIDLRRADARNHAAALSGIIGLTLAISVLVNLLVMRKTTRRLYSISTYIGTATQDVHAASGQLTGASEQISRNASSYAAALEEIHAALEEITRTARENATHTSRADQLSSTASAAVDHGIKAVADLDSAMGSISDSSKKITAIISRINDISFQTNILALNAAVEAARAGAAGAGFSVVADEVRKLAQRCAAAAAETTALIEESSRSARLAIGRSQQVGKLFGDISGNVRDVAALVSSINANFQQQSEGIQSVRSAVSQQEEVAQSTAAVAEETASSALSLTSLVNTLAENVASLDALLGRTDHAVSSTSATLSMPANAPDSARFEPAHGNRLATHFDRRAESLIGRH